MNKIGLLTFLALFCSYSFSQGLLRISASQNGTNNLLENVPIATLQVKIILLADGSVTNCNFSAENKNCLLKPGIYNVEIRNTNGQELKICEILIRDMEFTFLNVLFEPTKALSRKELRKRKIYHNYGKNRCV